MRPGVWVGLHNRPGAILGPGALEGGYGISGLRRPVGHEETPRS